MIRYHGTPITPDLAALATFKRGHAMVSFANQQQVHLAFEKAQGVALDNGAFSLWGKGECIDVPAYVAWVNHWRRHPAFEWAVIPDVIDGSEEENNALIQEWWTERKMPNDISVPVWHLHESLEKLEWLVSEFPRVAIGSSGEFSEVATRRWWERMGEAMAVACDSDRFPRTKLHGLRQMDPDVFSHIPYHSVDSCNVARNIGHDDNWTGSYVPPSKDVRALCVRDANEHHASAYRWSGRGRHRNMELFG